jgi:replicative DNA helicase
MLLMGRLGLSSKVLGFDVQQGKRVLYLAMDRPMQIAGSLRRQLKGVDRDLLEDRLLFWKGPPPQDVARHPELLRDMCLAAGADTVVIDSLKDAAIKLSDEETGQGFNRAVQMCVTDDIEVLVYHHQVKRSSDGKPKELSDVYGSGWITAGLGSCLLLWGKAGDTRVELSQLKPPAMRLEPFSVEHDQRTGRMTCAKDLQPDDWLQVFETPTTARDFAALMVGHADVTRNDIATAQRRIDRWVKDSVLIRAGRGPQGGAGGGGAGMRYVLA